jgi:hypothetical protein
MESATATVEATTATAMEATTATATAMKCRRGLRRHDGRSRRQQYCANGHNDFLHDYLPHHIKMMLLSEPAPRAHFRPAQPEGRIDQLRYPPWTGTKPLI